MQRLTKQEKHSQCIRESVGSLTVVLLCCLWHIGAAFALNGTGWKFLGMPAWFSVSVLGCFVLSMGGIAVLLKKVFVDFDYDGDDETRGDEK